MFRNVPTIAWLGIAAAVAMVIGSFGPWAKAFVVSVSGTDGSNDGWFVVLAAVVGGGAFLGYARRSGLLLPLLATLAGIGGAVVTIYDRSNLTSADDGSEFEGIVQVGWGLNLAMGASIALAIIGAVALLREFGKRGEPVAPSTSPATSEPPPPSS